MTTAPPDWYFDFVSPFAYLQHELLLRRGVRVRYRPVLLAALLKHWDNKGPAEIPPKRLAAYHYCQWFAEAHGIPMRFPPAHPFNPLPGLRLVIARDGDPQCITDIFRTIYGEGGAAHTSDHWAEIYRRVGVSGDAAAAVQPRVKAQLRSDTEAAAERGVFGVPTLAIGDRLFWGTEMTDMAMECLDDPRRLRGDDYLRLSDLPHGAAQRE